MNYASPFSKFLNTNYAPSEQEKKDVKLLINTEQVLLDDIDKEIRVLIDRRAAHARIVEEHSALLSPIRQVPSDILLSIFEYTCLKGLTPIVTRLVEKPNRAPKESSPDVLSHVCQQWRRLSLEHPILWSEISILPPPCPLSQANRNNLAALEEFYEELAYYKRQLEKLNRRILVYIFRSDRCPLTVTFRSADPPYEPDLGDVPCANDAIVDMLCAVSTRWKRLALSLWISKKASPLIRLFQLPTHDIPLLEQLNLDVNVGVGTFSPTATELQAVSSTELLQAPRLRSLTLHRFPKCPRYTTAVNWSTLKYLDIGDRSTRGLHIPPFPIQHSLNLLIAFPHLVCCSIMFMRVHESQMANISNPALPFAHPISLPHLKSLTLRGSGLPPGLPSSLELPSLQTLSLLAEGDATGNELVDWTRKFGSQLKEFTFDYSCLTKSALLQILESLPNITTLRMVGTTNRMSWSEGSEDDDGALLSDSVMERLTPKFGPRDASQGDRGETVDLDLPLPLCPKLRKIFLWPSTIEFTEKSFVKFVAARRRRHLRSSAGRVADTQTFTAVTDTISLLETAIVSLDSSGKTDFWGTLRRDDTVDLEGFVLVVRSRQCGAFQSELLSTEQLEELVAEETGLVRN
ncbi:hypothetical protein H1R20_g6772, partial [Candolleomyces eurysporus]